MRNLSPNEHESPNQDTLQEKAKEAYQRGDFDEALKLYRAALPSTQGTERQLLLSNIVACRLSIGGLAQAEAAVENAKQCIALNDRWVKGHVRLASAYIALGGHSNDACNSLQRAIQLEPRHPTARKMLMQELRRDHRNASHNRQDLDSTSSKDPDESPEMASEEAADSSSRYAPTPSQPPIFDMDDPPQTSSASSQSSWLETLQMQLSKVFQWYYGQSEDSRKVIHVCLLLVCLYVAFGGRFGFEGNGNNHSASYRRGNYGTGNAYDQYYGRHSSSFEHHNKEYQNNYNSRYSSYQQSQSSSYSGRSHNSANSSGSFVDQWNGHLTPILFLLVGAAYLCHRNGIAITEAISFVVWNILLRRRRRHRWGFGGHLNGLHRPGYRVRRY